MRHAPTVLLPLILLLALSPAATAAEGDARGEVSLYVISDRSGDTVTVFQEHRGQSGDTWRLGVPAGAERLEVRDGNGSALDWVAAGPGRIAVAVPDGAESVVVVVRDLAGPAERTDVAWPHLDAVVTQVAVAAPARYAPAGMERATADGLPAPYTDWPRPADLGYWYDDAIQGGERFEVSFAHDGGAAVPYALFVVMLVLLAATTVWLMRRVHTGADDPTRPKEMTILGHLEELRNRALWVIGTLFAGVVFFFTFGFRWFDVAGYRIPLPFPTIYDNAAAQIFSWLSAHVVPAGVTVVVISPWDAVTTQLGIAVALAVAVAFPVLFYHIYAFLAPALYPKERRAVFLTVPVVVVLFVVGAAFGLGLMLPFLIRMLYGFAGTLGATQFLNVPELVSMGALMALVFGIAFELPVVMALLSGIGVVPAATWRKYWRHAVVAIALVAAIITDPTILTQLIVGTVLFALYGIGIVLAQIFEKKAERALALEPEVDAGGQGPTTRP